MYVCMCICVYLYACMYVCIYLYFRMSSMYDYMFVAYSNYYHEFLTNLSLSYSDWVCTAVMSNDVMKDLRG